MTRAGRVKRLEVVLAPLLRPVVPVPNLDALTEDEVRLILRLQEKTQQGKDLSALTEDEMQAVIAIDAKVRLK